MDLRRQVELVFYPMTEMSVELPEEARIVAVEFYDASGVMQGRRPSGVWVEVVIDRWDDDHPERTVRPLPPPEVSGG